MLYRQALFGLSCFDAPSVSQEDRERTQMYVTERERTRLKTRVGSLDEWLQTLEMMVKIDELNSAHLPRAVQLLNKTNQMNLSTRRMTESELSAWADRPDRRVWTVHVSDKFGSSGLTGLVSVEVREEIGTIVDYLLSCRVMGAGRRCSRLR
jgi:FkbH-like protein